MNETKTEWFIIVNPRAGSGKTMSEWVPAEKKLEKLGISYVTAYTDHKKHATALAYDAAQEGYRKIMAVGGDGSLHEMVVGICRWCSEHGGCWDDFHVAVAPIGSGNDWIKAFDVPRDVPKVLDLIAAGSYGKMDVVRVTTADGKVTYMSNVGGVGFDSHVCDRVNRQKERGQRNEMIYANALRHTVTNLKPINIRVVADGSEVFSGPCYSLAMGNGKYSGSGMRQVPLATIDDGLLDAMIVPRQSLGSIVKELPKLMKGNLHESDRLTMLKCKVLEIFPLDEESADIIELDGEIEGKLPARIEMTGFQINAVKG